MLDMRRGLPASACVREGILTYLEASFSLLHLLELPLLPPHLPGPQEGCHASWQQQECPVQPPALRMDLQQNAT